MKKPLNNSKTKEKTDLCNNIHIKCLNVQGITQNKYLEIEREIDKNTIMCLTETQEKYNKITERKDLEKLVSRRKTEEKKVEV